MSQIGIKLSELPRAPKIYFAIPRLLADFEEEFCVVSASMKGVRNLLLRENARCAMDSDIRIYLFMLKILSELNYSEDSS